jgi:hypothetical protein
MSHTSSLIIVKAKFTFKSAEEGGRTLPFRDGYRPNHFFVWPVFNEIPTSFVGDIYFEDGLPASPGETKFGIVRFLNVPGIFKYLNIGQQWFINEGSRNVATAEIVGIS